MNTPTETLNRLLEAANAADPETYLSLYADDLRVFDAMGRWQITDRGQWADQVTQWLTNMQPGGGCRATEVQVTELGDHALVTALVLYSGTPSGHDEKMECWNRWTGLMRRIGEDWRIVHEHTSLPLSMEDWRPLSDPPTTA